MGKFIDLSGQHFGFLTAKNRVKNPKATMWKCICDCGNETLVRSYFLHKKLITSCGCKQHLKGNNSPLWKGYGEIPGNRWCQWKANATKRSIPFEITIKEAWNIFETQNGKCALSGVSIKFGSVSEKKETTASLDRINSALGYISGNVQWLHKNVNLMKFTFNTIELLDWCDKIVKYNTKSK
jgi:hypothetical protein